MKKDIKLSWFYPYPPETIWECLTDPEILKQWSPMKDFKPEIGFESQTQQAPRKSLDWDGITYYKVLEIEPLKRLSYSFKGGPKPGVINLDTVVTWILVPKNGGTELQLEQTGFSGARNMVSAFIMEFGWKKIVGKKLKTAMQAILS
jgi:uncharacterized protein YndB with AHSA1/START domain